MTAYDGLIGAIPLGSGGLYTDDPSTIIPGTKLIRAKNIALSNGAIEKDFGSRAWNETAVPSGIRNLHDWHPDDITQKLIVVSKEGRVFKFKQFNSSSEVTPTLGAPSFLDTSKFVTFSEGGSEESGNDKKLFILDGKNLPQVIAADGSTRSNISGPAADWTGSNSPFKSFVHRRRNWAFGNKNAPHRLYYTTAIDHEDFAGGGTLEVFPGFGQGLMDHFIFKGRLFVLKFPSGLYYVNDADPDPANWTVDEVNTDFGGTSPSGTFFVKDDILVCNNYGSITSIGASDTLGDLKSADLFANLRMESTVRNDLSQFGQEERNVIYYKDKKLAFITYQSSGGSNIDRIIQLDFNKPSPEVVLTEKDQPNCLALRRDNQGIERPIYGGNDGFIYFMDQVDRNVGGAGYESLFQTPHIDFSQANTTKAGIQKNFDSIIFEWEPTGDWDVNFEVFIDGKLQTEGKFNVGGRFHLDEDKTDEMKTSSLSPFSYMHDLGGQGRRISVKCYNDQANQNFKITKIVVLYKELGYQNTRL